MSDMLHARAGRLTGGEESHVAPSLGWVGGRLVEKGAAGSPSWTRWLLPAEVAVGVLVMAAVAWLTAAPLPVALGVTTLSLLVNYVSGRQTVRPGLPRPEQVLRDMSIPFGAAAVATASGHLDQSALAPALALSVAGGAVTMLAATVRPLLAVRQRVVVVGSAVDVAEAATRWAGDRRIHLVGSLVLDAEPPRIPRPRTGEDFGVPMIEVSGELRTPLLRCHPDMVIVVPGPAVDADRIRTIGWALEGTGVSLAVLSQLHGIAPHRVQHTRFAGTSLVHLRSSRPTLGVLAAKAAMDRTVGLLLLVLAAPVILGFVAAVRFTSPGAGIFRQVRVGRDGRPFTMYKLRTMVATAEEDKAALLDSNEGNGLLFKKKEDPRVTPLGKVLRKYSIDELPQLINVVKGDMSLVGPRPALPEEVAQYTPLEQRRLVVRPGMTGAWQVSGRSTLGRDESVRLDVDYADNYRLVDDVVIALRTVDAVARPKGAW